MNVADISWPSTLWLLIEAGLHVTTFVLVSYHCMKTPREATSALVWIFSAWAFPLVGPLFYLMFGINRMPQKGWHKQRADNALLAEREAREDEALAMAYWRTVHESLAATPSDPFIREIDAVIHTIIPHHPLLGGNQIQVWVDGDEAFPRMMDAIRQATHHVHIQTFIIGNDPVGRAFLDLLAQKARQGVNIRFLFDQFGCTKAVFSRLFSAYRGIPNFEIVGWTQANTFKRQFQFNLRNHRKIMIVDGNVAFTGGINLHQENITRPGHPPIRDYHFEMKGAGVQELQYTFLRDWYFMTDENPEVLLNTAYFPHLPPVGQALCRVINSGPTEDEMDVIADVFFECLVFARKQVLAVTPYFVPTSDLLHGFRSAARRGVDVRLLVPEKNNHFYAGMAGRARYDELLSAGVRIYERPPPFMHAKALIVDDSLALVGSANLDIRSLRLNYETNLAVFDPVFIQALKHVVLSDLAQSAEIRLEPWRRRPAHRCLLENFCHLLSPML